MIDIRETLISIMIKEACTPVYALVLLKQKEDVDAIHILQSESTE